MATLFSTEDIKVLMPREIADGMITQTRTLSTVAQLSAREPMRFGKVDYITFNDFPKAEFVEEGGEKSATKGGFGVVTAAPHKAQVTMRFNEEVQWASEDHQLGVLNELAGAGQVSLSRALDLGMYHRINPLTGNVIAGWENYVTKSTKVVEHDPAGTADLDDEFATAVGLLVNAPVTVQVTGAAFDPKFSWALSQLKRKDGAGMIRRRGRRCGSVGRKPRASGDDPQRYPQLGFGTNITDFRGIPVAQGNTVSGTPEATDTKVRAIVGDFQNGIRWGVQRELPIELIRFGDPDGQGDLKRHNQIALRLEIVYGWYVFVDRFTIIKDKA